MWRAYCYYNPHGGSIALRSEPYDSLMLATLALESLMNINGMTGGGIEREVLGIGWVIDEEVESIIIQHRLCESDRELNIVGEDDIGAATCDFIPGTDD